MDDGCKTASGYILNTQNFSLIEQEKLVELLKSLFQLEVKIHKDRNNYRLYICSKSIKDFTHLIQCFILPSFKYKLFDF